VFGEQVTMQGKTPVTTSVVYWNRTWFRASGEGPSRPRQYPAPQRPKHVQFAQFVEGGLSPDMHQLAASIRLSLARHTMKIVGHQRIDGVNTLKLTGAPGNTFWVNTKTYLPVRIQFVITFYGKQAPPPFAERTDFKLLAPTPANLKLLRLPVPHGFRKVKPY
jgi:hypothetical protein